jgi:hypothetical protein
VDRPCRVVIVWYRQSMRFVSRVGYHEFWYLTNSYVINTALHWAKQVMIEVGYVDRLVQHQ